MLLNIVIAVLLDAFVNAKQEEDNKIQEEELADEVAAASGRLDPLLEKWLESCASNDDLEKEIATLWCVSAIALCNDAV